MFKKLVLMCILAVVMCPVANATQVVSSDFSIGLGYTFGRSWDAYEQTGENVNTPLTQGDFTFSPSITSLMGTGGGWLFPDRVPTFCNNINGATGYSSSTYPWVLTLNASYDGVAQTGGKITVNITSMSIYGFGNDDGVGTFSFTETTAGNVAASPTVTMAAGSMAQPADWNQLVWNPGAFQVDGGTAVRSFGVDAAGSKWGGVLLDGFEITGNITYEYIPEPATMILLSLGGLLIRKR